MLAEKGERKDATEKLSALGARSFALNFRPAERKQLEFSPAAHLDRPLKKRGPLSGVESRRGLETSLKHCSGNLS